MSENSSLLSGIVGGGGLDGSDAVSERVRFDDNVSFIDEMQSSVVVVVNKNPAGAADDGGVAGAGAVGGDAAAAAAKLHKVS